MSEHGVTQHAWERFDCCWRHADYRTVWHAMQHAAQAARQQPRRDALWLVEHDPVFTHGPRLRQAPSHVAGIPVVRSDRGGLMTYHGPGQLVAYCMANLQTHALSATDWVAYLEDQTLTFLRCYGIQAYADPNARGVYTGGAKLASIGLRVKQGITYHGVALNVAMDLTPFSQIDPCGLGHIPVTDMAACGVHVTWSEAAEAWSQHLRHPSHWAKQR